jgi:hypothetical protein
MKLVKITDGYTNQYALNGGKADIRKMFDSLVKPDPDRWSVYFKAVKVGWLKPFTNPYFVKNPSVISIPMLPSYNPMHPKLLRTMEKIDPSAFQVDWDQLERTPEILDYQEDFKEYWFTPGCEPSPDEYIELAQFIVTDNRVGIVRDIQTGLTWWETTNAKSFFRGDPNTNRNSNLFTDSGPLAEWHLRIEPFRNDTKNNRIESELPGQAFTKLPTWRMMRFLWGVNHAVYWIIPANSILSLWCRKYEITVGQPQDWRQMAGLLAGATQPERSLQTFRNVTRAW